EEQEEIEREEDADDAGDGPKEIRMEEADPRADLGPRARDGYDAEEQGQRDHQQAEPVHREMDADAEARDPRPFRLDEPAGTRRFRDGGRVQPDRRGEHEIDAEREQRDPAHEPRALPFR